MDSNLSSSKSVPSNLATGRRHRVSISGSGSYQSHLSSLEHLHRVRTISEQIPLGFVNSGKDDLHALEGGLASEPRPRLGRLFLLKQIATDPVAFLLDDLRRIRGGHVWRLRTLLTLYGCFSVFFFTLRICALFLEAYPPSWRTIQVIGPDIRGTSSPSFINISLSQRLSIAFRELPPESHLDTFVLRAPLGLTSTLTACLWIEDHRIEEAISSASAWPGPVSLVIVTTSPPESTEYKNLLHYLPAKRGILTNGFVHILFVPSITGTSANTYLNMARFFAQTSRVVLFPDGISKSVLHLVSAGRGRWLNKLPRVVDTPHPVLLSNGTHRTFSSRPMLAPMALPRDHLVWCPERFYMFGSRALDWDDCVWNLWLESAGEALSIAVPHFNASDGLSNVSGTALSAISPHAVKMRLRWSARYRSEMCVFTLKRSQALGSLSKTEKRHMHWRKKFCRETVGPNVVDIP